ncbi:MAG TPA: LuxR C-terminal-related transcriptional regulator [Thermomicrobiales bacterium]|nr:LuxR C-terminal-related transcriptional regulator [Thermomicrobiales bacterium]
MGIVEPTARQDNLPIALSSLIGREQDIAAIRASLSRETARMLTLTGPGGVGKTRLALEAALCLRDSFPNGVTFVDLAAIKETGLVAPAVASAVGVREQQGRPLLVTLPEVLASHAMLLIFDSCEHVIGPCAELAEQLLRVCPDLKMLCTSQQRLGVQGEIVYPVPALQAPDTDAVHVPHELTRFDAVRLFAERAVGASPNFVVDATNAPAIGRICRQLDGMPLAIEIAAGWIPTLTADQIANRLDDRLRLLSPPGRLANPRQQTLRGAIEWSYDLLDQRERLLFTRLSVFVGGCTLAAIETVCAEDGITEPDIIHLLSRLVDKSLVIAEEHGSENRYRLLGTLRLYAREKLVAEGEAKRLHERHAWHFLELAEAAERELWGPNLEQWLRRLETEHENLRAALRWSVGQGSTEIALGLGAALCRYWRLRGHAGEGLSWLEGGLAWNTGASVATRAKALEAAGLLARDRIDYVAAEGFLDGCLSLRREIGDMRGIALALNHLGTVAQFQGESGRAGMLHEESLSLFRKLDDTRGIALSLMTLGTMAQLRGDRDQAEAQYGEALQLFSSIDDTHGVAASLNNLGNLACARLDYDGADDLYTRSMLLFGGMGEKYEVASCLRNLSGVARDRGNLEQAKAYCRDSLNLFVALGDTFGVMTCLEMLADQAARQNDLERSALLYAASEKLRGAVSEPRARRHDPERERTSLVIREHLGERDFERISELGRSLTLEQVISASSTSLGAVASSPFPPAEANPLSPREREVAALIARGHTNRQIAAELFIAERTVDTHVEHILTKLNVGSRSQVAAWIAERGVSRTP